MKKEVKISPQCQSIHIVEIVYGEIVFTQQVMNDLEKGEIYLGGCCVNKSSPRYVCKECGHKFGTLENSIYFK